MLKQNMLKILTAVMKKCTLDDEYKRLVESPKNEVGALTPIVSKEVRKFISCVKQSQE